MKAGYLAVAAAMAAVVSAGHHAGHAHEVFHNYAERALASPSDLICDGCGSYTVWVTTYGEATLHHPPAPPSTHTIAAPAAVPTPGVTTCPTPGVYTIPATTITLTETTTILHPTPATYAPGTYYQPEVVTTVTETDYVIFCPFTSMQAPAPTSAAAHVATSNANAGPGISASGNQWAVTYTPYTETGECKSASDVMADMALVKAKGFSAVRMYATDCNGLQNVGAGCEAAGLKLIVGVFIEASGISGAQEQVTEIIAWAQWSIVELIVIGNEAIFNGYCTPSDLASFISTSKAALAAAGYSGPCTTTEPLNVLEEYIEIICEVVDVVGCNIHPFFNGAVDASSAGSFVASQLQIVEGLCPGKKAYNLETGWPKYGDECNGAACATPDNQKTAVEAILAAAGDVSVILSFADDLWKDSGAFGCERSWGMIDIIED